MNRQLWQCLGIFGITLATVSLASNSNASGAPADITSEVGADVVEKIKEALPARAPAAAQQARKVLLFSKTNGFRHGSIPVGVVALKMLGEATGAYAAEHTEDESRFEPESLQSFDAVIFLNTTGEVFRPQQWPSDPEEKAAAEQREERLKQSLIDFVESGKGIAGVHSATDTYKDWSLYNDLMGGAFTSHPWHEAVPVRLLDADHPLNKVFGGRGFTIVDEIYQFRNGTASPQDRRMLLALDTQWVHLSKGNRDDNFYPISWIREYGQGRSFYCSLGHRDEIFSNPIVLEHYLAGIQYALGDLVADATPIPVE